MLLFKYLYLFGGHYYMNLLFIKKQTCLCSKLLVFLNFIFLKIYKQGRSLKRPNHKKFQLLIRLTIQRF
jgi:hypothetical protein